MKVANATPVLAQMRAACPTAESPVGLCPLQIVQPERVIKFIKNEVSVT